MKITIQVEIIASLILTALLCALFVWLGKQIEKADPLKPTKVVLAVEAVISIFQNFFHSIFPNEKMENKYTPYFTCLAFYVFLANIWGLTSMEAPTANFSITLTLALITFALIQLTAFKKKGGFTYIKELVWPPTNILSALAPLISLSMRLFGNIISGSILMALVYQATGFLSSLVFGFLPINVFGPIITPALHFYFDVFAGFMQTFIFVTLSGVYITMEA